MLATLVQMPVGSMQQLDHCCSILLLFFVHYSTFYNKLHLVVALIGSSCTYIQQTVF